MCDVPTQVFYEFLIEQNFRSARVPDISQHLVGRAHRRYNLDPEAAPDPDIAAGWKLLATSAYTLLRLCWLHYTSSKVGY